MRVPANDTVLQRIIYRCLCGWVKVEEAAKGLGRYRRKEGQGKASRRMCDSLYCVCRSVWDFDAEIKGERNG